MFGKSTKRQKELHRAEKMREKEAKRAERKRAKAERPERLPGEEDPDIAGIVPGPQPPLEGF